ncbi:MAG TPA: flagellar motor switch protein FliN [Fimbriimonadaceae bacterium]|nr:flagellar motor switch protein FliN [Fimbriimonadaceae bacterium]
MAHNPEIAHKLSGIQNQIWQTVSQTVGEAVHSQISFLDPESSEVSPAELAAGISDHHLVIQFAFSGASDSSMVLMLDKDATLGFLSMVKGTDLTDVNEALINECKQPIESLVQGICLAVGILREQTMVASGLSVRYLIPTLPPSLQTAGSVYRTKVTMSGDAFAGTLTWVVDPDSAMAILGIEQVEEPQKSGTAVVTPKSEDSLDILMDIPLQISVELGRVKMVVKDVVELGAGSIIEIDKAAGEPVDVMVNGRTVARGEVVVIEDNFGVRITEILSQQDRLARLKEAA